MIIGIDPGYSGGLAALNDDAQDVIIMPVIKGKPGGSKTELDVAAIVKWLKQIHKTDRIKLVVIERAQAYTKQGVTSSFNFGVTYGTLRGIIQTLNFPMLIVRPQAWKKDILTGTLKDKAAAINFVRRRYPNVSLRATERCRTDHDGMADATCIAEYGKHKI